MSNDRANSGGTNQRTAKSRLLEGNNACARGDAAASNDNSSSEHTLAPAIISTSSTSSSSFVSYTRMFVLPRNIDVFGFNLTPGQSTLVFILAFLMLGPNGGLAFAIALGAYTGFQRVTASASSNHTGGSSGSNRRRVGWSGGGANIRGVKDLPKPPSGG